MSLSALQTARKAYQPKLPPVLRKGPGAVELKFGAPTESVADQAAVKALLKPAKRALTMRRAERGAADQLRLL